MFRKAIFFFLFLFNIQGAFAQLMMDKKDLTLLVGVGLSDFQSCKDINRNSQRTANKTNCYGVYYISLNYGLSKRFSIGFSGQVYQQRSEYQQELYRLGGGSVTANVREIRTYASFPFRLHYQWLNKKRITISTNIGIDISLIAHKSSHDQMAVVLDPTLSAPSSYHPISGSNRNVTFTRFPTWDTEALGGFPILNACLLDIRFRLSNQIGLFLSGPSLNISGYRAGLSFKLVRENENSFIN